MLFSLGVLGRPCSMPGASVVDNRFSGWSKNVQTLESPVIAGFRQAMRILSTRLSPQIGGNSSVPGNLCLLWTSARDGATLSTCRLWRSVQGFFTDLSTEFVKLWMNRATAKNPQEIMHKQDLIKKRTNPWRRWYTRA
ncbi:hypothetical protein [Pseudomonas sp. CAM1A]|uniref:hypothetical protein n=1 Tax=Pseudomonas sp. CAM1A TaxID=3231717 RepID=UPI0039C7367E